MALDRPLPDGQFALEIHPLTSDRWDDFEQLFGKRGAYGGCWCMWWRISRKQFSEQQGEGNRQAMKDLVEAGEVPGILAYLQGKAVGWCSVAPREQFASLGRSRVLKPIDDESVWSLVCLFVARTHQGKSVSRALIRGAIDYVGARAGTLLEAYPTDPRGRQLPPVSSFMGTPALFAGEGFEEVARPSESKVIMRYRLDRSGD